MYFPTTGFYFGFPLHFKKVNTMRIPGKNIEVTVNNLIVSYNDEGQDDAPAIIFIHGFPLNKSMWNQQSDALKDSYRVIAYDVRGHGNSENSNTKFSIDLFADDLVSLMDELKLDTVILCGLSMGGYIALNAVERYPGRFDALILSDTQCIADSPEAIEKRKAAIQNINENGVEKYADESIKNLFALVSFTARQKEIEAVRQMIVNTTPQSLCNTLLALAERKETCASLSELSIPVLIMVGKEDKITPPEAALMMHKKNRNSKMYVLENAGHLANIENDYEFNTQLREFTGTVTKKSFTLSDTDGN